MNKKFSSLISAGLICAIFLGLVMYHYNLDSNSSSNPLNEVPKDQGPLTPQGIRLTAVNDSYNSMVITWYTENEATDPKIVYSKSPLLLTNNTVIPSSNLVDGTYIYTAELDMLDINETYYYQVFSDSSNKRNVESFTTGEERNTKSIKFMVFGDSRSQREVRRVVIDKITDNFNDLDFTIHTGDMIYDGRIQDQWNNYFNDVENLTKTIHGYYIEGNHEHTDGNMYENIPLPSNGANSFYYSFNIGPVKFIGLNTNRDPLTQASWLENELKIAQGDNQTFWNFAFMHEPIFNSRDGRTDRTDLVQYWCPLFEQYGVDLVFAGHNHYYERNYPMNNLKEYDDGELYEFENPRYPMYITTGGAGAPLYTRDGGNPSYEILPYTAYYNSTYHFIIIEVHVNDENEYTSLTLETWAIPENAGIYGGICLIDRITILKKGIDLIVNTPDQYEVFGHESPNFNISLVHKNLDPSWYEIDSTWYTIDDGITNYTFTGTAGKINQTAWELKSNGTVTCKFFAKDALGKIYTSNLILRKDIEPPVISIISPEERNIYGKIAPSFQIEYNHSDTHSVWYSLDGGQTNYTISSLLDNFNSTAWSNVPNGSVIVKFFINDTTGNQFSEDIMIYKDIIAPLLSIKSPSVNETFGSAPPSFIIEVIESNLHKLWYSLDGGLTNVSFTLNGSLDSQEWSKLSNGVIRITFYSNDTLGNISKKEITIIKNDPEQNTEEPRESFPQNIIVIGISSGVVAITISIMVILDLRKKRMP